MEKKSTRENSLYDRCVHSTPGAIIGVAWMIIQGISYLVYYKIGDKIGECRPRIIDKITKYRSRIGDLLAGGDQYFEF